MQLRWIEQFQADQLQELFDLYRKEWWTENREFDDVMRMIHHSDIVIGSCTEGNKIVGFCRVLTDFTFKAMIFDVIVDQNYRGYGIGKHLVQNIISHDKLKQVSSFELYCPERLVPFYQKLDFEKGSASLLFHER